MDMGYTLAQKEMQKLFEFWKHDYCIYGPKRMIGEGMYSDTDVIRYEELNDFSELEWKTKSNYSFKEVILPITQRLFYFTENEIKEANQEREKGAVIFMRSCDVHSLKRLDEIYLRNHFEDFYYKRLREKIKIVLIGCEHSCENGFCVSMGTNQTDQYDLAVNIRENKIELMSQWEEVTEWLSKNMFIQKEVKPEYVQENQIQVQIPEAISEKVNRLDMWREYDNRCIACGRCNFVCPTCTCFTMQDIFYTDNGKVGERRRVHASCMVDGYTDVAGGGSYRKQNGDRMRFKVLHKISDFKKQFGYQMCTGCGRCDDICPEYISFSACVNRLAEIENQSETQRKEEGQ